MNKIYQLHIANQGRVKQPVNLVKNEGEQTLLIYDIISSDWGVNAIDVIAQIDQADTDRDLNVRFNSPGGDVFEGRAIMAAISRFKGKTIAHIDSLCASAATSIALACNEVVMSDGAFFMIHNASGIAFGDKTDLRETADLLEKIEGAIVTDYVNKTGKEPAEIVAMMEAETWFDAKEALANGFIDRIADTKSASNAWNLSAYTHPPKALVEPAKEPEDKPVEPVGTTQTNANRLRLAQI